MNNETTETKETNPRLKANVISKITFWYTIDLFRKGFKRELEEENLYDVLPQFETSKLGDQIERQWSRYKKHKNSMFVVLGKMYGKYYCLLSTMMLFTIILNVVRPMIIGKLVSFFIPHQQELTTTSALLYTVFLIGLQVVDVICRQNYIFLSENLIIKIRTAFCSLIYRKFLRLPASRLGNISFGNVANLITRDISAFDQFFINFTYAWSGLIVTIILCYNMYCRIGLPAVVAVVAFAVFMPLQALVGIWMASLKRETSVKTDQRLNAFREVCSNIKSTRMYAWESHMENKISSARKKEMNVLLKIFLLLFLSVVSGIIINNVTFYLVVTTYVWMGRTLTAETMYFINGTFLSMYFTITIAFPYTTFCLSQVVTAVKRMQCLLRQLEVQNEQICTKTPKSNQAEIHFANVKVMVGDKTILEDVTLSVNPGLTIITGPASSGKSLFLLTILKEFETTEGKLVVAGRLSYASQEPWLFPATIRQNILFGSSYNHKRYKEVLEVCDLQYDLDLLQNGDSTIVADGGINLSKGQRCRINLARAVYQESDIYLIDDCLSSLDSVVANYVFGNCILKFLQGKLVLLATHNPDLTHYATQVVNLNYGQVTTWKNNKPETKNEVEITFPFRNNYEQKCETIDGNTHPENSKLIDRVKKDKVFGEEKKSGAVSLTIYRKYISLGGGFCSFMIILGIFILTQLLVSYKDRLIGDWVNLENTISQNSGNITSHSVFLERRNQLLYNYTAVVVGISLATLFRGWSVFLFSKNISINLHKRMLNCVLNASLKFFDATFVGNIVNRFSKDLDSVDESIPFPLHHLISIVLEIVGNILLISSTNTRLLLPVALLFASLIFLRYVYVRTGRPLKRLDASTKSPVIGYLKATLEGLPTIRASHAQVTLKQEFEGHHNLYNSASYSHAACLKGFVFIADILASIFVAVVILQFVVVDKDVLPGDVGLAISQSFSICGVLFFGMYKWVDLETQMTSAERAIEYTAIQQETKSGLVLNNWPTLGEITYENVNLTVDDSKSYLLKNVNFNIKPNGKLGIVGRTGAGKSSIISALFRLYDFEGRITIDGIDIKTLSLDFLRSSISVIPQDPVLFSGTIRSNIDPDGTHKDEEIWTALSSVKLEKIFLTLDTDIKEFEFTCSQKRLLSLARVLIKNTKIVAIDEIVEHMDSDSEHLIYDVIDKNLRCCTIIKIAHKLKFVLDCDAVLVLENGNVIEYDKPDVLLKNQTGLFYKMFHMSEVNGFDAS